MTATSPAANAALCLDNVSVRTHTRTPILTAVDLVVATGSVHALIGESGSGKSTLALTALGHLRPGLRLERGTIQVAGTDVMALGSRSLREHRRTAVSWLGQEPALSLTPHLTVRELITEIAPRSDEELIKLLGTAALSAPLSLLDRRPHELSGGQRRRIALARALATRPRLLILDEPTSGLDPAAIEEQAQTLQRLTTTTDLTVLLVTHDLQFAATVADVISVMSDGQIVETSTAQQLFTRPSSHAAAELVHSVQLTATSVPRAPTSDQSPVVEIAGVDITAPDGSTVVRGLDLTVNRGDGLAIVGPSGAGKSTIAQVLIGRQAPDAGTITWTDPAPARPSRRVALIPQDSAASLNPALTVQTHLTRAVRRTHPATSRRQTRTAITELLSAVGLTSEVLTQRPGTLSGGQAQRVAIARALAHEPQLLICDESTSAVDPTVQRGILDTLNTLRLTRGLALIVITHAPEVARYTCDRTISLHAHSNSHSHHERATDG